MARELSRGDTNAIGRVVHVVENCNDPNAIGQVVCVVDNLKNPARPKIPLLMETPNAFIFLYSCDFFTLIMSCNSTGTVVDQLRGVDLLRCTIILTNECHWRFNACGRRASILDGRLQMNVDKEIFGHTPEYGTSIDA